VDSAGIRRRNRAGCSGATASSSPPQLRRRVFRGSAVVRSGLLTRHQLHSSAWQRLYPDVYACAEVTVTHELRAASVTRFLLPGSVSGRSAALDWNVGL
jgi:hypothetical protein